METLINDVKEYYGKILQSKDDLKTSACCAIERMPSYLSKILEKVHPEVTDRFYGCGAPFPLKLKGSTVLDLGSGSGRDCYMLSPLVGEEGSVIGIDMTDEQLLVARKHKKFHQESFGHSKSNVDFKTGYIEDLKTAGIKDQSIDVIVSNCVINLSPNKEKVFSEMYRVLKNGGEIFCSDVFCDRRLSKELREDPTIRGECLGGALYIEDFRRIMQNVGCPDYRIYESRELEIHDPKIKAKLGAAKFYSITFRAFKVELEDRCEDYGQIAVYKGGIEEALDSFKLDDHHLFEKDRPQPVCQNTANMLSQSRFKNFFNIVGDPKIHFGLFNCESSVGQVTKSDSEASCC